MTVAQLIEALQQLDQSLEVYAYTDHGQSPQKVSSPEVIYTEKTGYHLWDEWVADMEEADEEGYNVKSVLI